MERVTRFVDSPTNEQAEADSLHYTDEKEVLRAVLILGQLYQHMDRRLYAALIEANPSLRVSSVASALSSLYLRTESSHPIHLYALESYFRCLLHSPSGIASEMVQQVVEVAFLVRMNGRSCAMVSSSRVALSSSFCSWSCRHFPHCVRRGS